MAQRYAAFAIVFIAVITIIESKKAKLRFVNVVFRHGDRTPDENESYLKDRQYYSGFYPMGFGDLTNNGKRREYALGNALRNRYENFLGKIYMPDDILARSTDFGRTKMSLSLVLAGLFPPSPPQKWNPHLNWQPIPINYLPIVRDALLIPQQCARYLEELDRVLSLPEVIDKVEEFRPLLDNLTIYTVKPMNNLDDMYFLYHNLMAEYSMNLKLPDWVYSVFPYGGLYNGTILEYDIFSYNVLLKRLNGEFFIFIVFRPLSDNLTIYMGNPMNNVDDMYFLYHNLMAEYSMNLKLPDWVYPFFPYGGLYNGTILEYDIFSYNDLLKRLNGGPLLKRFLDDMVATVKGTAKEARKMNLFCCHELNVAGLLKTLGVWKPHIPEYSSAVIVELLEIGNDYYIKVLHYLGIPSTIEELAIPGCDVLCLLDDFLRLLQNVTPTNDELNCPENATISQAFRRYINLQT